MKILYTNDMHIDNIITSTSCSKNLVVAVSDFINSYCSEITNLEEKPVVIIGGDISDSYSLSLEFLKQFSDKVEHLFLVFGNHDYYLSNEQWDKSFSSSTQKIESLKENINQLGNVTILEGFKVYDYKGIKICGDTYWYAINSYKEKLAFNNLNDSILIKDFDINYANNNAMLDYENLDDMVDIIVTHIPTIYTNSNHKYGGSECFYTPIESLKSTLYLFGHVHENETYNKAGHDFITNHFNQSIYNRFLEINITK